MPLRNPFSHHTPSPHAPNSHVNANVQGQMYGQEQELELTRGDHTLAYRRVQEALRGLRIATINGVDPGSGQIEDPETGERKQITTQIDILEPYEMQTAPWAMSHLWSYWKPPADGVSLSRYAHGEEPRDREAHFRVVEERTPGWVFPFALGGREASAAKDLPKRHKPHALIVAKDPDEHGNWRSWIGGIEPHSDRPPTLFVPPQRIATGSTIASNTAGGYHRDRAIEGLTDPNHPQFNERAQMLKLWRIGGVLIERGEMIDPDFVANHLGPEFQYRYTEADGHNYERERREGLEPPAHPSERIGRAIPRP